MTCQRLDQDGRQCRKRAVWSVAIFSDPEIRKDWFAVAVCEKHRENSVKQETATMRRMLKEPKP